MEKRSLFDAAGAGPVCLRIAGCAYAGFQSSQPSGRGQLSGGRFHSIAAGEFRSDQLCSGRYFGETGGCSLSASPAA